MAEKDKEIASILYDLKTKQEVYERLEKKMFGVLESIKAIEEKLRMREPSRFGLLDKRSSL